jgi:hypothetical protein
MYGNALFRRSGASKSHTKRSFRFEISYFVISAFLFPYSYQNTLPQTLVNLLCIFPYSPVVTYSSETWTPTIKDENNLRIFERQILRKIFGPVNSDNIWRIRNNMEINKLIEDAGIVRFIKAQKLNAWDISKEWSKQDQLGSY